MCVISLVIADVPCYNDGTKWGRKGRDIAVVKNKKKVAALGAACVVLLLAVVCVAYVNDYYRADESAVQAFAPVEPVVRQTLEDGTLVYVPEVPKAGFIFYPGGKVEHAAYEPLMEACAAKGFLCVLVEMPFRLAVLDINAADGIREQFPDIHRWYIGGHSLGGSMAASYLGEHAEEYEGLILLGSYSTEDLSGTNVEVLSVYGSEDGVLNRDKYKECIANLPGDYSEVVIEGGCHAWFGMYGAQSGDGVPSISNEEQIHQTAQALADFAA